MSRGTIEREEKLIFFAEKRKSKDREKEKYKFFRNFAPEKNGSRKQRRCKPFNPRCAVEEVRPNLLQKYRTALEPWTFPGTSPC
jgi:hypothetical protein